MKKFKYLNKNFLIIVLTALIVISTVIISYAWFYRTQQLPGVDVQTGDILTDFKIFSYDPTQEEGSKMVQITEPSSDEDNKPGELQNHFKATLNPTDIVTYYIVVERDTKSIDIDYSISFVLDGYSPDYELDDYNVADIAVAGGFECGIRHILIDSSQTESKDITTVLENYCNTYTPEEVAEFDKPLSFIHNSTVIGDLYDAEKVDFYRLDIKQKDSSINSVDRLFTLHTTLYATQIGGLNTDVAGNIYYARNEAELNTCLTQYAPGDTIHIASSFEYSGDLIFNRPVNLYIDAKCLFKIIGNLQFSFTSPDSYSINTQSTGQLLITALGNTGGRLLAETPNARLLLTGSNLNSFGKGDIYVQRQAIIRCSTDRGLVIDKCNIYGTDNTTSIPKDKNDYKEIVLGDGTKLTINTSTRIGPVRADSNTKLIHIQNSGIIDQVILSGMAKDEKYVDTPQIYLRNNGVITDPGIILPGWAVKHPSKTVEGIKYSGNTRVIQDKYGSEMVISTPPQYNYSFVNEDIEVIRDNEVVIQVDNDPTNLFVTYSNGAVLNGETTLKNIMDEYFSSDRCSEMKKTDIKTIKIRTIGDRELTLEDYNYLKTMINLTSVDLGECDTYIVQKKVNNVLGYYAYIPSKAFNGLQLTNLVFPSNAQYLESYLFTNDAPLTDITLPTSTIMVDTNSFNNIPFVHIPATPSIVTGLNTDSKSLYLVEESMLKQYRDSVVNTWRKAKFYVESERDQSEQYLIRLLKDGTYEIVRYLGSDMMESIPFEAIYTKQDPSIQITVSSIGSYAYYGKYNKSTGPKINLTFSESVVSIGESAFRENQSIISVNFNNVVNIEAEAFRECPNMRDVRGSECTTIGPLAFHSTNSLVVIYMPKAANIDYQAFWRNSNGDTLKLVILGKPEYVNGFVNYEGIFGRKDEYKNGRKTKPNIFLNIAYDDQTLSAEDIDGVADSSNQATYFMNTAVRKNIASKLGSRFVEIGDLNLEDIYLNTGVSILKATSDDFDNPNAKYFCGLNDDGTYKFLAPIMYKIEDEILTFEGTININNESYVLSEICARAFYNNANVYAPYLKNMDVIGLPEGHLIKIGNHAFREITSIKKTDILTKTSEVGACAFYSTSITDLITDTVTKVGAEAFSKCNYLVVIRMKNLVSIDYQAFWRNSNGDTLKLVILGKPEYVNGFVNYEGIFGRKDENKNVRKTKPNIFLNIAYDDQTLSAEAIGGVADSSNQATYFMNTAVRKNIASKLGSRFVEIGDLNLEDIYLNTGVSILKATSDDFDNSNAKYFCGLNDDGTYKFLAPIMYKIEDEILTFEGTININNESYVLSEICARAFYNNANVYAPYLKNMDVIGLPEGHLIKIGNHAFREITSIKKTDILTKTSEVGACAFYSTSITDLITNTVTKVGAEAFSNCNELVVIRMKNLVSIDYRAFWRGNKVDNLKLVILGKIEYINGFSNYEGIFGRQDENPSTKSTHPNVFLNISYDDPTLSEEAVRGTADVSRQVVYFMNTAVFDNIAGKISSRYVRMGDLNLDDIYLNNGISIMDATSEVMKRDDSKYFYGLNDDGTYKFLAPVNYRLDEDVINFKGRVTINGTEYILSEICGGAFRNDTNFVTSNLTTLNVEGLPEGRTIKIGSSAFRGIASLVNLNILEYASEIGYTAFYNCPLITDVDAPECTKIDGEAFALCSNLVVVNAPKVTSVGWHTFYRNTDKLKLVILGPVDYLSGDRLFGEHNENITSKKTRPNIFINVPHDANTANMTITGATDNSAQAIYYLNNAGVSYGLSGITGHINIANKYITIGDVNVQDIYLNTGVNITEATSADLNNTDAYYFYGINSDNKAVFLSGINYNQNTVYHIPDKVEVGGSLVPLEVIAGNALRYSIVTEFSIPQNIKTIGNYAFYNAKNGGDIVLNDVKTIGNYAFQSATASSIHISNVDVVKGYAFASLTVNSIHIANTDVVEGYAFYYSNVLGEIFLNIPKINSFTFHSTRANVLTLGEDVMKMDNDVFRDATIPTILVLCNNPNLSYGGCTRSGLSNSILKVYFQVYSKFQNGIWGINKNNVQCFDSYYEDIASGLVYHFIENPDTSDVKITSIVYKGVDSITELRILNTIDGKKVTGIDKAAFTVLKSDNKTKNISTIILPYYLDTIELDPDLMMPALDTYKLSDINGTDVVTTNSNQLFVIGGILYKNIDGVDTIVHYPPAKTDTTFVIPDTIGSIGAYAFAGNDYIQHVIANHNVTVYNHAFDDCDNFISLSINIG